MDFAKEERVSYVRFNGDPSKYHHHLEQVDAELIAIPGPSPDKNGLSLCKAYVKPAIGFAAARNVPLWEWPAYLSPQPEFQARPHERESREGFSLRLMAWRNEQVYIDEERKAFIKVTKTAVKTMRAMFSEAGLEACGRFCDSAMELYLAYTEFATKGNIEDARLTETNTQAMQPMQEHEYFNNYYTTHKRYMLEYYNCDSVEHPRFRARLLANVATVKRLSATVRLCELSNYDTKKSLELLNKADRDGRAPLASAESATTRLAAFAPLSARFPGVMQDWIDTTPSPHTLAALMPAQLKENWCENCGDVHTGKCRRPCRHCVNSKKHQDVAQTHSIHNCGFYLKMRYGGALPRVFDDAGNSSQSTGGPKPVCFKFQRGQCTRGDKCKYRHDLGTSSGGKTSQTTTTQTHVASLN